MLSFWPPTPTHLLVPLLSLVMSLRMSQHKQPTGSFSCSVPAGPCSTNCSWRQQWELRQTSPQRPNPFSITMRPILVPIHTFTNRFFSLADIKISVNQFSCFNMVRLFGGLLIDNVWVCFFWRTDCFLSAMFALSRNILFFQKDQRIAFWSLWISCSN